MPQLMLSIFLLMPFTYEEYTNLRIEAAIEGITVEQYIAEYIRHLTDSKEVLVEIEAEKDLEAHCIRADCSQ